MSPIVRPVECRSFSSQHDPEVIVKVIDSLRLLLFDDNILVQKKLIVSMVSIYRLTLKVRG